MRNRRRGSADHITTRAHAAAEAHRGHRTIQVDDSVADGWVARINLVVIAHQVRAQRSAQRSATRCGDTLMPNALDSWCAILSKALLDATRLL